MSTPTDPIHVHLIDAPKSRWRWLLGIAAASVVPVWGLWFSDRALKVSNVQLRAASNIQFHELITKAIDEYCPSKGDDTRFEVEGYIERAAGLEQAVRDDLIAIDYVTLASVGANFWPHERSYAFGKRAEELATAAHDQKCLYIAHIILGDIDLSEYKKTGNAADRETGREHLRQAALLASGLEPPYSHVFSAQVYKSWAAFETDKTDRNRIADEAISEMEQSSPKGDASVVLINSFKSAIANNEPARFPCPRDFTLIPASGDAHSLVETQARQSIKDIENEVHQYKSEDERLGARLGGLESELKTLNKSNGIMNGKIEILEKILAPSNSPANLPEDVRPKEGLPPSKLPGTERGEVPPKNPPNRGHQNSQQHLPCGITLINTTGFDVYPVINGFDSDNNLIPPFREVSFWVQNDVLSLRRRGSSGEVLFSQNIFWKSDGTPVQPVIKITNCCFEMIDNYS